MVRRWKLPIAAAGFLTLLWTILGGPALAAPVADPLAVTGTKLVRLLNGEEKPDALFTPEFLKQVPAAQVDAISASLRTQLGRARSSQVAERQGDLAGSLKLEHERGTSVLRAVLEPGPQQRVSGLLITDVQRADDTLAAISSEFGSLPGQSAFAVAKLEPSGTKLLAEHRPDQALAVGSAFKLFILAELSRQVRAGERRWSDVVPLSHKSLPSGFLQSWPAGSPMTLYGLAALMISQSDNSATDTLLHLAGREQVEALLPALGIADAARNRPLLSTMEAFALKGGNERRTARWIASAPQQRRAMLKEVAATDTAAIDLARLQGQPNHIDRIEWFASPRDLVRTLDWLRREGGKEVLEILAINPGLGRPATAQATYLGYKGGSETGVIAMNFLLRDRKDDWYAVAASWNNPAGPVAEERFRQLMSRAVSLLER